MEQMTFFISNAFHVYIMYRYASRLFFEYSSKKKAYVSAVCYYLLNTFSTVCIGIPLLNLLTAFLGLFFLTIPSREKASKKIFFMVSVTCLGVVTDIFVYYYVKEPGYLLSAGIIMNFILLLFELIIETYQIRKNEIQKKEWGLLCSVPVCLTCLLLFLDMDKSRSTELCLLCAAICFIINIVIFYLYDRLAKYYEQNMQAKQNELQIQLFKNRMKYTEESEKQMNAYRHDLHNHLSMLKEMAVQEDNQNIIEFLNDMMEQAFVEQNEIFTKHKEFNLLMRYLCEKAKAKGIMPVISTDIPLSLKCNMYDMNIVLSNLFDNAVEAAEQTDEKKLELSIKYVKGMLLIYIINSFEGKIFYINKQYLSNKSDLKHHGFGIKNTEKIIEKYHGNLELSHERQIFCAKALMYLE